MMSRPHWLFSLKRTSVSPAGGDVTPENRHRLKLE